jgi:hypothetical protein
MPDFEFLAPPDFCLSNGGSFETVHPRSEVRTESRLSVTDAFIGYRVDFPEIGIGRIGGVRLWNDNFGVFKNRHYMMDSQTLVAGADFYRVYRPHGIALTGPSHISIPDPIAAAPPKTMAGNYVLIGSCLGNHSHMLELLTRCLLVREHVNTAGIPFLIDEASMKYASILNRYFPDNPPDYLVLEKDTLYEFEQLTIPSTMQCWPALHPEGGKLIHSNNRQVLG